MSDRYLIVEPSSAWGDEFRVIAARLRRAFGDRALRIDHIGSTAVDGLHAKDVIDVQVTVASLDDAVAAREAGFRLRPDIVRDHCPAWIDDVGEEWRKAYADAAEGREVHVHIRVEGRPNQRYALLFRDYLRAVGEAAKAYEEGKRVLAEMAPDRAAYVEAKDRFLFDLVMVGAEQWAAKEGWEPGPSDA